MTQVESGSIVDPAASFAESGSSEPGGRAAVGQGPSSTRWTWIMDSNNSATGFKENRSMIPIRMILARWLKGWTHTRNRIAASTTVRARSRRPGAHTGELLEDRALLTVLSGTYAGVAYSFSDSPNSSRVLSITGDENANHITHESVEAALQQDEDWAYESPSHLWDAVRGVIAFGYGGDDFIGGFFPYLDDGLRPRTDPISIYGGAGNDTILGEAGHDILSGGPGDDWIRGWGGNDEIVGGEGNDELSAADGGESDLATIRGGDGNDVIWGSHGNDFLDGGAGNDAIWGFRGADTIRGGEGNDQIFEDVSTLDSAAFELSGDDGFDTLKLSGDVDELSLQAIADGLDGSVNESALTLTDFEALWLDLSGSGSTVSIEHADGIVDLAIWTAGGNDEIDVQLATGTAILEIDAGAGSDTIRLFGRAGALLEVEVDAGSGNDLIELHALGASTGPTFVEITGSDGTDTVRLFGTDTADSFYLTQVEDNPADPELEEVEPGQYHPDLERLADELAAADEPIEVRDYGEIYIHTGWAMINLDMDLPDKTEILEIFGRDGRDLIQARLDEFDGEVQLQRLAFHGGNDRDRFVSEISALVPSGVVIRGEGGDDNVDIQLPGGALESAVYMAGGGTGTDTLNILGRDNADTFTVGTDETILLVQHEKLTHAVTADDPRHFELLNVFGEEGDDELVVNVSPQFAVLERLRMVGGDGDDSLLINGTPTAESAVLRPGSVEFTSSGIRVSGALLEEIAVEGGGGHDEARLIDSAGDDEFVASPAAATLAGAGFSNTVHGFARVDGYGRAGGADRARLYDSSGEDVFRGRSTVSFMKGDGYVNYARGFFRVDAYSDGGGFDRAFLYDTSGDELFTAESQLSSMAGSGFALYARQFARVDGYGRAGGTDAAVLKDSDRDDVFRGRPTVSFLVAREFANYARGFDRVDAYSENGGEDRAFLYDTLGEQTFVGREKFGRMTGDDYDLFARGFRRIDAYSTLGSNDRATLFDSTGDDLFRSLPTVSYMVGPDFTIAVRAFRRVEARSMNGGDDRALLFDGLSHDQFTSRVGVATFAGNGFENTARNFALVYGYAGHGDTAVLQDVLTGESIAGTGNRAVLRRTGGREILFNFDRIEAHAGDHESPRATIDWSTIDFEFEQFGDWN